MKTNIYLMLGFVFLGIQFSLAQNITVEGTVTLNDGTPLPGVTIMIQATSRGTVTDFDGNYTINADNGEVILYSFVGYETESRIVGTDNTSKVVLNESAQALGEVVLVGSRNKARTAVESPVPVDVVDIQVVQELTGQTNVNQLLQFSAPSFNSNQQSGSDGSDAVDAATLRGLGPDQTLVLINGKRYHQSSLINLFGTKGRGNTGTDLNTIPVAAIKRVEILRDGAAAQYGSDAIAGVVNIVLEDRRGVGVNLFSGINVFTSPGGNQVVSDKTLDGFTTDLSVNYGLDIGSKGFGNFTVEYIGKNYAFRNANPDLYDTSRERFGDAKSQNIYVLGNMEIPLNDNLTFYSVPAYSHRNTDAYAWTRFVGGDNHISSIYSGNFNPIENTKIDDFTFNNGVKFNIGEWDVDVYNALGTNKFMYDIHNTLNATLEGSSPTRFDAGGHSILQNSTGFGATRNFGDILGGLNIAFGSEFRYENFKQIAGEEASYASYDINGNIADRNTPENLLVTNPLTGNVRPGGSQGFPGYSTDIKKDRSNIAFYVDSELEVSDEWMVSAAARFENYSDFGSTLNGKFSTRYAISPQFALRGSVSTGFRAPSLAQRYYTLEFTNFQGGEMVAVQLASNDSHIAQEVGIPSLKEEKSVNASTGFTFSSPHFTATVDGYFIGIKDRIVLTGHFDQSDDAIGDILIADRIDQVQFFTNAIDTRTMGVDVVLSYSDVIGRGQFTGTLAGNINHMKITDIHTTDKLAGKEDIYLEERERAFILASAPKTKFNLNLNYKIDWFTTNLQLTRFHDVRLIGYEGPTDYQDYTSRITTDLSFGFRLSDHIHWVVGTRNLFNRYPTLHGAAVHDGNTESGGIFDPVQMGFAGRQLFTSLNFKF